MSRTLLITGATGKQGGAVIRSLLARKADFQILALTRDVNSPSAKRLASSSPAIKLLQGDLDHAETIFQSAKLVAPSIWGVFSVQVRLDILTIMNLASCANLDPGSCI